MTRAKTVLFMLAAAVTVLVSVAAAAQTGRKPGEQSRWTLEFRVRLDQPGEGQPVEIDLNGDWISTISAVRPGEYDVRLQIANPRLTGENQPNAASENAKFLQRLGRPFWATYRDDGSLLAIHFFKDVTPSDRNLLQMIATETQLNRPGSQPQVWTALERDGGGTYLAIYQCAEPSVVVKRKLKYVYADGAAGAPANTLQVDIEQSELRYTLDASGEIVTLNGTNRVRMGLPIGGAGQLTASTTVNLSSLRKSQAPEQIGSLARAFEHVDSTPIVTHQANLDELRAASDSRLIHDRTTDSLLEAATAKEIEPTLPYRLAALFRQRTEAPVAALALIRKNGSQQRITDALGSAGTPAAIDALASLARDRALSRQARVDALVALIIVQHPGLQAMRVPETMLDDDDPKVASAARIVSGALARTGREEHPAEADKIDAALSARFRKAQDPAEIVDLIVALGNSAGPSVLPMIEESLHDSHTAVRVAAAHALRLPAGQNADRLLATTIATDPDPEVRAAAIFSTSFRRPIGVLLGEALLQAASTDAVEWVRSDAISMLGQNPGASPRVVESLAWIAENDAKPGVRRVARSVLDAITQQQNR